MSAKSPFSVAKSPFVMVTAPFLCIECPCFLVQSHVRVVFDPSSIPSFESELTVNQINPNKCHANLWWIHHNFAASNSHITTTPFPNLLKAYWHDALVLQHGPINGHLIKCSGAKMLPALSALLSQDFSDVLLQCAGLLWSPEQHTAWMTQQIQTALGQGPHRLNTNIPFNLSIQQILRHCLSPQGL